MKCPGHTRRGEMITRADEQMLDDEGQCKEFNPASVDFATPWPITMST
jgi:hypothetical protein